MDDRCPCGIHLSSLNATRGSRTREVIAKLLSTAFHGAEQPCVWASALLRKLPNTEPATVIGLIRGIEHLAKRAGSFEIDEELDVRRFRFLVLNRMLVMLADDTFMLSVAEAIQPDFASLWHEELIPEKEIESRLSNIPDHAIAGQPEEETEDAARNAWIDLTCVEPDTNAEDTVIGHQ